MEYEYKKEKKQSTEEAFVQFNDIIKDVNRETNISILRKVFAILALGAAEVGAYVIAKSVGADPSVFSALKTGSIILNGLFYTPIGLKLFKLLADKVVYKKLKKMVENGQLDVVEVVEKFKKAEQGIDVYAQEDEDVTKGR